MRVLIDAHQLGMKQTGNETWCRNLLQALPSAIGEHDVHVAVTKHGVGTVRELTDLPHHLVSANGVRRLAVDVPAIVNRGRFDAVLGQYTMLPSRAGAVVMIHDLSPLDPRAAEWLPLSFRLRFRASVALSTRLASVVLTPSQYTRHQIIDTFGLSADRVQVAPNAVDGELAALLDTTPRVQPSVATVLSVGNVLPRKNLTIVADAIRRLQLQGLRIKYRIVGNVGRRGRATAHALRQILPDVEMVGYASSTELAREYRSATLLAFPSLFEGFGIPAIEAMRAHLPVVCSSSTSLPEVAGDACLAVPPDDIAAWEASIKLVSSDAATQHRLSSRGYTRSLEFDWRSTAHVVAEALLAAGAQRRGVNPATSVFHAQSSP